MNTTTARCDGVIALIDKCLDEYESAAPLLVVHGNQRRSLPQAITTGTRPSRTGTRIRTARQLVKA